MTVKQARLLKHLKDKDCKTLKAAAIKAGYSPTAGNEYNPAIKRHIQNALKVEPESIKKSYIDVYDMAVAKQDLPTAKGTLDSLCRITGMNKDNTTLSVRYAPDKLSYEEFKAISDKQSQDIPQLSQKSDVPNNEIASDEGVGVSP